MWIVLFCNVAAGIMFIAFQAPLLEELLDGAGVTFAVTDTGVGMNTDIKARVFEPFFTTQLGRGGSGLGLSIVYNLVTRVLGGSISVTSEVGQGTTFTLSFPVASE